MGSALIDERQIPAIRGAPICRVCRLPCNGTPRLAKVRLMLRRQVPLLPSTQTA